jgi:hypothetical protein
MFHIRGFGGASPLPRPVPAAPLRHQARLLAGLLTLASLTPACAPPHPAGTLIVASKACIDWLDALRDSPSMDLHQGDCIELPPAVIRVLEPVDPAKAVAQLL